MFEGIVHLRKFEIDDPNTIIDAGTVNNSITAQGLTNILTGRMFGSDLNAAPKIHVYTHTEQITPAVCAVSGYFATCDELVAPTITYDDLQQLAAYTVVGRLMPTGVARTVSTVGLAYDTSVNQPAFAVRLSNPVTQSPSQIVEITYTLIARKSNMVSTDVDGSPVYKVSNNVWDAYLQRLTEAVTSSAPVVIQTMAFVDAPDDFSTGSNLSGRNSLVENLGTTFPNVSSLSDIGITTPTTAFTFLDETTVVTRQAITASEAVGVNFNKSCMMTNGGIPMYVNDIGYTQHTPLVTAQNTFTHSVGADRPYPNIDDLLATSIGSVDITVPPYARTHCPTLLKIQYTGGGDIGTSSYMLAVRPSWGFTDNVAGLERSYRLPAMSLRSDTGDWIKTTSTSIAYTGTDFARFNDDVVEAFSVVLSRTAGSTYNDQVDTVCIPSSSELTFVSNLGTTVTKLNSTTVPSFTASDLTNYATVQAGGLTRLFVSCTNTGLWRINQSSSAGTGFAPAIPFVVAIPNVDPTKCYAVASRNVTGDDVVVAMFDGGLARSLNGGTVWSVYNPTGDAGTLPFESIGLTDSNWNTTRALILGPTDLTLGITTLCVVQNNTVVWVELTPTGATVTGTSSIEGVHTGPFLTQKACAYFPQPGSTVPSSQTWIFYDGVGLVRVPYTTGVGPGSLVPAPSNVNTNVVRTRFFERPTAASTQVGMVLFDNTGDGALVLVDDTFGVIVTNQHLLGRALTDDEIGRLTHASCRPYRHFYMTSLPQITYFNPFFTSELYAKDGAINSLHHLAWTDYEYLGGEWIRVNPANVPVTSGTFAARGRRPTHSTPETIFSSSPTGILTQIPAGIELQFNNTTGIFNATVNEFTTCTLTSGIQKDAYTECEHQVVHAYYRVKHVRDATIEPITTPDFVGRNVSFITRELDTVWFSQQGVVSSIAAAPATITRSELTTLDVDQTYGINFRVTHATSSGRFAIGIAPHTLVPVVGTAVVDVDLPIHILFEGNTYVVVREGVAVTAPSVIAPGMLFGLSVNGSTESFEVTINGTPIALTSTSIPSALMGTRHAVGVYGDLNEHRYAYDVKITSWPITSIAGTFAYYKILDGTLDIGTDPLLVTVESRLDPPSSSLQGATSTEYFTDPRIVLGQLGAIDQVKLLPKSGLLLVNDVADIESITFNCLVYKK